MNINSAIYKMVIHLKLGFLNTKYKNANNDDKIVDTDDILFDIIISKLFLTCIILVLYFPVHICQWIISIDAWTRLTHLNVLNYEISSMSSTLSLLLLFEHLITIFFSFSVFLALSIAHSLPLYPMRQHTNRVYVMTMKQTIYFVICTILFDLSSKFTNLVSCLVHPWSNTKLLCNFDEKSCVCFLRLLPFFEFRVYEKLFDSVNQ